MELANNQMSNKKRNKLMDMSRISAFHIDIRAITSELIIEILKKQPFQRDIQDYAILNEYILYISKLSDKFRSQRIPQKLYEKIVLLSLQTCKLKLFLTSNSQIYTPETESHYLYIILKGSVKIIKIQKQLMKLTSFEYYQMIINFRNNNEKYLLKNTINENYAIFPIELGDIDILDKILLKIFIINKKESENDYDYLDKLLKKLGFKYEDFGLKHSYREDLNIRNKEIEVKCKRLIPFTLKEAENYAMEQERIIYDKLNYISYEECQKYMYFLHDNEEFITKFELVVDKILTTGECFGDYIGSKYIDFTESAEDNLYLLMIKNNMINQVLENEKDKTSSNLVDFFINNFFFRSIKKYIFEKYYLNIFEQENYQSGQKICVENETVKYLYFIKKGRVKLSYNKSIIEIHSLINIIREQIKAKKFDDNSNNEDKILKFSEKFHNYYKMSGDIESIKSELNNKQERNIMIYQENQCLGYESYYYGLKYLYTAKAVSDNVEVYKISITQLAKIFNNKNEKCYLDLSKQAERAIFFYMQRLIKINNLLLNFCTKRKTSVKEAEKNQTILEENNKDNIINKNNNSNNNIHKKRTMLIKKAEISKVLPNLIKVKDVKKKENIILINNSHFIPKIFPLLNSHDTSSISSRYDQSEYEKNILNNKSQLSTVEKCENIQKLKKIFLYKKLSNHKRKLFITSSRTKTNDLNLNKSKDNSINSSYNNISKYFRESKNSNLSSLPLKKSNYNEEPKIIINAPNEKKTILSSSVTITINNESNILTNFPVIKSNEKKLIGDKLRKFMNIKKNLLIKKSKIYKSQKDKLQSMLNSYVIED